jgi:GTP cyclohydrolase I
MSVATVTDGNSALPRASQVARRNREVLASYVTHILNEVGLDLQDPSIKDTPVRWVKMLLAFNTPFDAKALLTKSFQSADSTAIVAQTKIPFAMLCEHHLLPAYGHAHIAYLPQDGVVVGLSKLARLVDAVGHEKPFLQESINDRIVNLLSEHLKPRGVICVIQAEHTCMTCRGVSTPGVITSTSVVKGAFRDAPQARAEAFQLFQLVR